MGLHGIDIKIKNIKIKNKKLCIVVFFFFFFFLEKIKFSFEKIKSQIEWSPHCSTPIPWLFRSKKNANGKLKKPFPSN